MGVGAAFVMPGTLSILATVFPPAERARAIGVWASVAGGSVAVSITWSGAMLEHFWWGSIFLGMAAVGVIALVVGWWLLPTSRHPDEARLDPAGALLSMIGVTGLLYGFIQAPDDGWTAAPILGAFAAGVVALGLFVAWERGIAHTSSLPSTSSSSGATRRWWPACTPCPPGWLSSPRPTWPGLGLLGVGIGLTMPPATGAIMSSLPPHKAGVGSAINDLDRELGGAFGIGVLGSLTFSSYRSQLASVLASRPASVAAGAKAGLAQALSAGGGAGSPLGMAARQAYSTGLDLAMAVGAGCVAVAAIAIALRPATSRDARVPGGVPVADRVAAEEDGRGQDSIAEGMSNFPEPSDVP
jgi:MFS family permease